MLQMNMMVTVPKEKVLPFTTITRFHTPEVTNIYTAFNLQRSTLSFSLGINFLPKINSSTFVYFMEIMLCL
jgi:hypothetical protein